ncbi:MAG: DUF4065 domain-containing protein [Deltaproteobacteria bacterium]|jgi:hypothetical protein|nr:DUF4065 domain-containing protein [Deltaproteobacteria bacterium]
MPVFDVADYFIVRRQSDCQSSFNHFDHVGHGPTTNLKLQKLVYYAQGFNLAALGCPLFDEEPEAWDHGPVSPDPYEKYGHFRRNPVASDKTVGRSPGFVFQGGEQSFGARRRQPRPSAGQGPEKTLAGRPGLAGSPYGK